MSWDSEELYWSLAAGITLIIWGAYSIITGDGGRISAFGIPVVDWIGWILLPAGIVVCLVTIRSLLRGPKKYTDEEVAKAKEELDRIYCEEHAPRNAVPGTILDRLWSCLVTIIPLRSGKENKERTYYKIVPGKRMSFQEHSTLPKGPGAPLDETNHKKDAQAKNPEQ